MTRAVFVTGTDTEIGKTWASVALMHALARGGASVTALKPVAAGTDEPSDMALLAAACTRTAREDDLCVYPLAEPVSPHIAAQNEGIGIDPAKIAYRCQEAGVGHDWLVVEGVGGWLAPLRDDLLVSDLARHLGLPVVLVVGLRLGCLNHALLSGRQILQDGMTLAGWIGNILDPEMKRLKENIDTLRQQLPAPCLGILPHLARPQDGAVHLDVSPLNALDPGRP